MTETQYDPTDAAARVAVKTVPPIKTNTSYNEPGLPTPPAGWGKQSTPGPMPAEMC